MAWRRSIELLGKKKQSSFIRTNGETQLSEKTQDHTLEQIEEMELYSISFDGEKYHFRQYRYGRLEDAVDYAKKQDKIIPSDKTQSWEEQSQESNSSTVVGRDEKLKEHEISIAPQVNLEKMPVLSTVFFILAALSFLGGIILTDVFWPGDPGYGSEWKNEAYTLSIMWFTVGVIETALFAAIGQGLSYLHRIMENTSR